MKRLTIILLTVFLLVGCSANKVNKPVSFYYPPTDYIYSESGSILDYETRETAELPNTEAVLELYMKGPQSIGFYNPFPAGCKVISLLHYDSTVALVISDELAQLSGISLPMACAALAKTCMEITGADIVSIRAERQLLGGKKEIVMARDNLNIDSNFFATESGNSH